jgi:hypothetical protein
VLRHQKLDGESFGVRSPEEAGTLLDLETATGAVSAGSSELALLLSQIDRAVD